MRALLLSFVGRATASHVCVCVCVCICLIYVGQLYSRNCCIEEDEYHPSSLSHTHTTTKNAISPSIPHPSPLPPPKKKMQ